MPNELNPIYGGYQPTTPYGHAAHGSGNAEHTAALAGLAAAAGFSQRAASPIVAALPPQPLSGADVEAVLGGSPHPGPSASATRQDAAARGASVGLTLAQLLSGADKALEQVRNREAAGQAPRAIDTARRYELEKSYETANHVRNGTRMKKAHDHTNEVSLAAVARREGNHPDAINHLMRADGTLTPRGKRCLEVAYGKFFEK
ncbi:hypothetical protein [Paraburkholderia humisilvae]|uniref:Uncharacterized protein n=1 Tax=Paraburkholderia humisilvae TaxID=627669 RepID=A0A6J5EZM4_9BURK|nr:hypothetical protein [Paraburkholderia humisilvae]CAB3770752.1 hypothetical protein LMG29542_06433 [Paraburkholderia humisilvae]